jgi:protoheme IX farnesyltransferase
VAAPSPDGLTAPAPAASARAGASAFARDLLALGKPRITALVVFTFGGGLLLAPGAIDPARALIALVGTTLVVAAANALNMYLERDVDGLMRRTRRRPLPAGRLPAFVALALGAMLASAAIPLMLAGGGFLVAGLGLLAFYAYVCAYTPLKRRSWTALYVGAVPGAMPPLMGWAAVTGRLDPAALALFAVMFVWQIPHFVAISIFRAEEYEAAGFRVLSLAREPALTRATVIATTVALLPVSLLLPALGAAGILYTVAAVLLGLVFLARAARGLRLDAADPRARRWAKGLFLYSLIYLVLLFAALAVDRTLRTPLL